MDDYQIWSVQLIPDPEDLTTPCSSARRMPDTSIPAIPCTPAARRWEALDLGVKTHALPHRHPAHFTNRSSAFDPRDTAVPSGAGIEVDRRGRTAACVTAATTGRACPTLGPVAAFHGRHSLSMALNARPRAPAIYKHHALRHLHQGNDDGRSDGWDAPRVQIASTSPAHAPSVLPRHGHQARRRPAPCS